MTETETLDFLEKRYLAKLKASQDLTWADFTALITAANQSEKDSLLAAVNTRNGDKLEAVIAKIVDADLSARARAARNSVGTSIPLSVLASLL